MMSSATSKIVESTKKPWNSTESHKKTNCSPKFVNLLLLSAVLYSVTHNKCFLVLIL